MSAGAETQSEGRKSDQGRDSPKGILGSDSALLLTPCVTWRTPVLSGPQFPYQYNEGLVEMF